MPPTQLVPEVNKELQGEIPDGRDVILVLQWPFSNKRAVNDHLITEISSVSFQRYHGAKTTQYRG